MIKNKNNLIKLICFLIFIIITSIESQTYIVTRLYCDTPQEESFYPNTGTNNKSYTQGFQRIYWQCAIVMFSSSKKFNPNAKHLLFTNKINIPQEYNIMLKKLGVNIINIEMKYQTPKDFYYRFRNTFYMFDVINYLAENCTVKDEIIILDSDCVWLDSYTEILKDIKKYKLLNYNLKYSTTYKISDLTRQDYKTIYQEMLKTEIYIYPSHFGAEIIACDYQTIKNISKEIDPIWKNILYRFKNNEKKFVTEEHVLSYIFFKLNLTQGYAEKYLKRIWTIPKINNIYGNELNYIIWHLPAEKNRGFVNVFNSLVKDNSKFWNLNKSEFQSFCKSQFLLNN